jgi:hypothetical protein
VDNDDDKAILSPPLNTATKVFNKKFNAENIYIHGCYAIKCSGFQQ